MAATWLVTLKAALPYIESILAVVAPVFTKKKVDSLSSQTDLLQKQIDELQQQYRIADILPLTPMQQGLLFHATTIQGHHDDVYAMQLDITVRARPAGQSIEAAFDLLDKEREIVVRTFAAVTTPEMHRVWGRRGG